MSNITRDQAVGFISDRDRQIYELINYAILTSSISLFGVVANTMNIAVFYKQGFGSTINISFFGLAISDLCALLTLVWFTICINPLFIKSNQPMVHHEIQYLTAGMPHICFARITGWITIFITAERCLCIMIPLKIKEIITPKVTKITISVIYTVIIISFLPEYVTTYIDWKFYADRNTTLLGLVFRSNHKNIEGLVFFMFSILGIASFVAVIILTVILVIQLKRKSKWRKKANADKNSGGTISSRERRTVTMVIMIATVLIVCYTPGVAVSIVTFFEPEFNVLGLNVNAFFSFWSFGLACDAINSSINIFLYYKMSTKYRDTFRQIVCVGRINVPQTS